jgi:hypothetical protein
MPVSLNEWCLFVKQQIKSVDTKVVNVVILNDNRTNFKGMCKQQNSSYKFSPTSKQSQLNRKE